MTEKNLLRIKWSVERPRRRSLVVGGAPRVVEFKHPIMFMDARIDYANADDVAYDFSRLTVLPKLSLWAWSADEDLGPATPLRVMSLSKPGDGCTHVYANGVVCFDGRALSAIEAGMDPVEVFWGSSMSVLPRWVSKLESPRVEPQTPAAIGLGFSMGPIITRDRLGVVSSAYHEDDQVKTPRTTYTPRVITEQLVDTLRRLHGNDEKWLLEISAPWISRPRRIAADEFKIHTHRSAVIVDDIG